MTETRRRHSFASLSPSIVKPIDYQSLKRSFLPRLPRHNDSS